MKSKVTERKLEKIFGAKRPKRQCSTRYRITMNMTAETRADIAKILTDAALAVMQNYVSNHNHSAGYWSLKEPKQDK